MESRERLDLNLVERSAEKFYKVKNKDAHCRFMSWEHCYSEFLNARNRKEYSDDDIDYLCLHLSVYLASWGMYRN